MKTNEIIQQTKLAFDFIQKLYYEVSYFIKEIEGMLALEPEGFIIGKPGGYQVTSRGSTGLETNNVNLWALRKLSIFFVQKDLTKSTSGITNTKFSEGLKLIYLRIVLDEKDITQPYILFGVLYNLKEKVKDKYPSKIEELIRYIEYRDAKVFYEKDLIDYEDNSVKFSGKLIQINLFDINASEAISEKVVQPVLKIYREINP